MERIRLESPNPISARDIKWSIEALSRRIPGAHCLVQSVAGYALFRKYGYEVEFCVGVAKPEGKFAAHAWLEHDGRIIIGGADSESRFTQFGVPKP